MKDQNSEEINEGNIPALLGSKLFVFFVFTKSWVANALKSSVLMKEHTYFTFDIDTNLYYFAFIMNVKGKKQST